MAAAGLDPESAGPDPERLARVGCFVELHIEQGRGLVDLAAPVGVATMIRPHGRWRVELTGRADHAGTTRLSDRDDPMLRLAVLVPAARDAAARQDAVATVGKVDVRPNAVNAIPSRVTAWLDVRADSSEQVLAVLAELRQSGFEPIDESWTDATRFDPELTARLARLSRPGHPAPALATGAGHDAGILAAAGIPTAMLFVRNPTGVSHAPDEYAEPADVQAGVDALATVLADLSAAGVQGSAT
jgi:N-carbamoyl-L-amino-acid hydrolase